MIADDPLLKAMESSNVDQSQKEFDKKLKGGGEAWEIHLSLFPVAQQVLNPPFINPHLPKMYRIYRELVPYLKKEDIPALIKLEITEYARRPKLEKLSRPKSLNHRVSFNTIESGINEQDWEKTAVLMATYIDQQGTEKLARRLLLLGSGYLDRSLGHSVSCTGFILLEILERESQDPWPALVTLADYFCRGRFRTTPSIENLPEFRSDKFFEHQLLKATSGRGIINLHHTITLYAIERVRHLFSQKEYSFMSKACLDFIGDKKIDEITLEATKGDQLNNYTMFSETFAEMDAKLLVQSVAHMIAVPQGRLQLGRFLIKGLCDNYQGNYNPHCLTGLGSVLWIVNQYWKQPQIVVNALFQYLDFYFDDLT